MRGSLTVQANQWNQVVPMIEMLLPDAIEARQKQRMDLFFSIRAQLREEHEG